MTRITGVEPRDAGWMTRFVYWMVQRKMRQVTGKSRLIEPIKIVAHHPRLLKATVQMQMGQGAACLVPVHLKSLASIKAATLVGCPF